MGKDFTEILLESDLAISLKNEGIDVLPSWANGAKVLLRGLTAEILKESGTDPGILRPYHVMVGPQDEAKISEALQKLSYRARPRMKERTEIAFDCKERSASSSGDQAVQ